MAVYRAALIESSTLQYIELAVVGGNFGKVPDIVPRCLCSTVHNQLPFPQCETIFMAFVDGSVAPSTNIMDIVLPYAPGFALWENSTLQSQCAIYLYSRKFHFYPK